MNTNDKHTELRIIFDAPPSPVGARFIDVENVYGKSVNVGEWDRRPDKNWSLTIRESDFAPTLKAENERLQALNAELVEALEQVEAHYGEDSDVFYGVRSAIRKGKEQS